MRRRFKLIFVAGWFVFGFAVGCSSAEPEPDESPAAEEPVEEVAEEAADKFGERDTAALIEEIAEGGHRSEDNTDRNEYRNPVDTLTFFGLEPDMDVVEVWPGTGWYTEILAPIVAGEGQLTAGIFEYDEEDPDLDDYRTEITLDYLAKLKKEVDVLGDVKVGTLAPPETVEIGEPESVEMVLTFRNLHNMYDAGILEEAVEAFYEVLEPGGTFGVVQHRAPEGSDPAETGPEGYLSEDYVVETVEAAGFELEKSAEFNANPDDTADYEEGVWALPPTLRGGPEGVEYYEEIGESDRMTLRFAKL